MTSSAIDNPVIFFDSGIGGLPYLELFRNKAPGENVIFFADSENFPYGVKSEKQIRSFLYDSIFRIIDKFNPKLIVIACNTASVTGLAFLRKKFAVPFVGVVPAVKPAAEKNKKGRIGILATKKTINGPYLKKLISDFASGCKVEKYGDPDIVTMIEYERNDIKPAVIEKITKFYSQRPVEYLVLACTHFIFISDDLQKALGEKIEIIDSRQGVINQALRIISYNNAKKGEAYFYTSGKEKDFPRLKNKAEMFDLKFMGNLD